MARPVGFEQDPELPDGTGTFLFDDGTSLFAQDPELANLTRQFAPPQPEPDMRTAQADPFAGTDLAISPDDPVYGRGPSRSVADAGGGPPQDLPELPTGGTPGAAPRSAPPGAAAGAQPGMTNEGGIVTGPDGRMLPASVFAPVHVGAQKGGPVAKKFTESTEGGLPADIYQEQSEARADASIGVQMAQQNKVAMLAQRYENDRLAAEAAAPELARAANQAKIQEELKGNYFKAQRSNLERDLTEYERNAKPDPGRYFAERGGVFGAIGAAIAQGLGAYAAIVGKGGRNFAQEIIQEGMARDLQTQEEEIARGAASRKNALARFMDDFGMDLNEAKAAVKLSQQRVVDNQIKSYAAYTGQQDLIAAADEWVAQNDAQRVEAENAFQTAALGKRTESQSGDIQQARRGGTRPPTEQEILARITRSANVQEQLNKYNKQLQGPGPDAAESRAAAENRKAASEERKVQLSMGEELKNNLVARQELENWAKSMGAKVNWETGDVQFPEGDIPGAGLIDVAAGDHPILSRHPVAQIIQGGNAEANRAAAQARGKFFHKYRQTTTGAAFSPEESADYEKDIVGDKTEEGIKRGLSLAVQSLSADLQGIKSKFGDGEYQEWLQRQAGTNVGAAQRQQQQQSSGGRQH